MAYFDKIKLEKGMYATGKSFSQVLEQLDPSEQYAGTPLEGLDAFQRQLKRFDIRVGGAHGDIVEKFFQTSDSAALFPEYVSRSVARDWMKRTFCLISRQPQQKSTAWITEQSPPCPPRMTAA